MFGGAIWRIAKKKTANTVDGPKSREETPKKGIRRANQQRHTQHIIFAVQQIKR